MYSKNTTKFDKFLITKILEYKKLLVPLKKYVFTDCRIEFSPIYHIFTDT